MVSDSVEEKSRDGPEGYQPSYEGFDQQAEKEKSIGVRKVEIYSSQYKLVGKIFVFFSVFLVSYAYGLDSNIRYVYQATATSSYAEHSLLSTVNVIKAVIGAAGQPVYARLSDVFGRLELFIAAILFYVVGTIIESQAYDVQRFAGGAILFQVGYTGIVLLMELIVADFSFLNWRLVASFVPALPFIINTWISGNITGDMGLRWSWGIGMWAIIFPVASIPLLICLIHMRYRAHKSGQMDAIKAEETDFQRLGFWGFMKHLFWQLDVVGIILLIAVFALILVPFTIAGGVEEEWKKAKIIAPLVIGFCCIPVFAVWEFKYAPIPLVPMKHLRNRTVYSAVCIAVLINFIWYMQGDYMYTVLVVAVNQSTTSANRITSLYSFVSVITGTILGLIVARLRYLKGFIVFGTCMWLLSMGLLIHYRGGTDSKSGIIGSMCVLGFGAGLFTYPVQVMIQASVKHEHMAIITSLYLASYNIGSALGGSVSGAIWTQILPKELSKRLSDPALVTAAYGSPFTFIISYPWGTPERMAVVEAYKHVQKILLIVGTCLCVPLIFFALIIDNYKLESVQSLPGAEKDGESESLSS
ncbi:Sit1p [Sugiyamaella lignohabitans]|uniref:Sit1p n=1 Tax=Sugiyamaella lignohabitans TaxID=796027 RepID=A0A167ED34_9ASCO|nr:Sit1p [Sugiyamaella lignohabitans]ANB13923.1 Sit1p [Sugiyamaella lignohabitans]